MQDDTQTLSCAIQVHSIIGVVQEIIAGVWNFGDMKQTTNLAYLHRFVS